MLLVGQLDSPFVRRVAVSMTFLALPFERDRSSVFGNFEEVSRINPLGRVPALVLDDGTVLCWSTAPRYNLAPGTTYFSKFGTLSLTGDIGLDEIVGDLCDLCDLEAATDYDATPLASQRVRGYAVGRESDARAAIEPLRGAFFFDGVESDGKVELPRRLGDRLDRRGPSGGAVRRRRRAVPKVGETRKQDHELPQRFIVKYVDADRDFQIGAQQAKRIAATMGSRDQQTADVPIVMTAAEAIQAAQKGLYLAWIMRTQYAIALPLAYLRYDPADVLTLTWNGGTTQVPLYVTEIGFGADGVLEMAPAPTTWCTCRPPRPARARCSSARPSAPSKKRLWR
jgi:Putative phage tail protein/Glutathione S-transferase, N-terminal domain